MNYTNDELERIWYNLGNTTLAQAYGELADLERQEEERDAAIESKQTIIAEIQTVLDETDDAEDLEEAIRKILVDNS